MIKIYISKTTQKTAKQASTQIFSQIKHQFIVFRHSHYTTYFWESKITIIEKTKVLKTFLRYR